MKKQVLIGSVLLAAISAFSQTTGGKLRPTGIINTRILADIKYSIESPASAVKANPVKPTAFPLRSNAKKTNSINWQLISSSMNIYGVTISYSKPLQWNDELNVVTFVHRKSPTYAISPTPAPNAETGGVMTFISTNCGTNWDSTALFANDNFWGRYPNGAIYNPPANTDINNAYFVGAGPTTGTSGGWIGNWYASKKLGTANYNNAPSTVPNAQQVIPTSGYPASFPSREDFAAYAFTATDDGKMRVLAGITNDATTSDTAVMLSTGTFSSGVFAWEGKIFDPPVTVASDATENWVSRPTMAWNEQGTIGYVVIMGSRLGATGSNVGLQPIVYKTINSGSTWSLEGSINFNLPTYKDVMDRLWAVSTDANLKVPNFNWAEGIDCAVDANNKLHIFTSLLAHPSNDPDSMNYVSQWTTERYRWPHQAIVDGGMIIHPYLYDFIYDGATTTWSHMLIDSMSTESTGQRTTDAGYQDNLWDPDPTTSNQKVKVDARLQMSRTPDGQHLLYTWAESDTSYTDAQKKWNNLPNIKARLYDVANSELSETEIDVTVDAGGEVGNRAISHFISPKFKLVSKDIQKISVQIPMTISNSNPYAQRTTNVHWYTCAGLDFARLTTGIAENKLNAASNSVIYPNPAKNNATVKINLNNASKVQVEVLNTIGQVVKASVAQGQTGANSINVDLSGLSSGIYMVNIKVDNASSTKKLVVE